jgi:hypothetical protein
MYANLSLTEAALPYKSGKGTKWEKDITIKAKSGDVDFSFYWEGGEECDGPMYDRGSFWTDKEAEYDSLIETMIVIIGKEVTPWMKENGIVNFTLTFVTDQEAGLPLSKSVEKYSNRYGRKYGFDAYTEKGDFNVTYFTPDQ